MKGGINRNSILINYSWPNFTEAGRYKNQFKMIYSVVNTIDNAEIEFEVDRAEFSIEVTVPNPCGDAVGVFYLSDQQVRKLKDMIDKAVLNMANT